jgi:hypothetical protein
LSSHRFMRLGPTARKKPMMTPAMAALKSLMPAPPGDVYHVYTHLSLRSRANIDNYIKDIILPAGRCLWYLTTRLSV